MRAFGFCAATMRHLCLPCLLIRAALCIHSGGDKGGYFHENFVFGKRKRCKSIKRKKMNSNRPSAFPATGLGALLPELQAQQQLLALSSIRSSYLEQLFAQTQYANTTATASAAAAAANTGMFNLQPLTASALRGYASSGTNASMFSPGHERAALLNALRETQNQNNGNNFGGFNSNLT